MEISLVKRLETDLVRGFGFDPTPDQARALELISRYCLSLVPNEIFLLKGYAGTGKTTLIKSLVKALPRYQRKSVLMAPTGRAAKVMGQYSGKASFTIHKYIYRPKADRIGSTTFSLRENKAANTIYIVDEASMISDSGNDRSLSSGSLLADLLAFVKAGVNCRLILVGDTAQLPPVGSDESPALDGTYLGVHHRQQTMETEMKTVMRQAEGSDILSNATQMRNLLLQERYEVPQLTTGPGVIRLMEGFEVEEALNDSFAEAGREGTSLLVRSNKRAGLYNRQIRARILWQEDEISAGDFLMVVKNNYHWLPEDSKAGFIANGDIIELMELYEIKELYGHRFARVKVRMVDYPNVEAFETMLLLDVLDLAAASLSWEDGGKLYQAVLADYQDIPEKFLRHKKVRENPYFNALQVKFAYAITCHKAQGGQWENVFIERPWLPTGEPDREYLRWLYTAFTRARKKVFLIGFDEGYFGG